MMNCFARAHFRPNPSVNWTAEKLHLSFASAFRATAAGYLER
jgi:hypothetical protein